MIVYTIYIKKSAARGCGEAQRVSIEPLLVGAQGWG